MTVRRVARFRPHRLETGQASRLRSLLAKGALRLLDLLAISLTLLLVAAPYVYARKKADQAIEAWAQPKLNEVSRVETDWMTLPAVPGFTRGDEPAVKAFLQAQPLVVALQDRGAPGSLWLRKGATLVKDPASPFSPVLRQWFAQAEGERCFAWYPAGALPDEERAGPKIILRGEPWLVAKRWKEGSPEVEQALRNLFPGPRHLRIALVKEGDDTRKDLAALPWGEEPNLQVDPYGAVNAIFSSQMTSNEFSGWTLYALPFRAEAKAIQHGWRVKFAWAILAAAAVGAAAVLALYLRYRTRRKAALDADRMASMTHSLKTPLAILKFRCDTLRLGRLAPDEMDAHLIQIGEEADRLSGIIENALTAIQGSTGLGPQAEVTPQWLTGVAEDLAPAFEAVNRRLVVACAEHSGMAALPSLRAALSTLMENALAHGEGTVTLETFRARKRLLIKVSDEGSGLDALAMKALGRPFMRIREQGKEGFRKDGQGLGLSLLTKMVEREGWGLTFASEPGKGLCATLEIQTA